ncbi:hypothetical protein ACFS5M_12605 [Lacinutrix iliipiscaria]|uniref:Haem-binding uptake Tiki superfamily ChaN domain-containing protein n=1 Tax=Lacinutrix iliipiscaria TaxID=1230532 RepID=A0ABW5WTK4_9FLAO
MKKYHLLIFLICLIAFVPAFGQDSLTVKILNDITYHFEIKNNKLQGKGAEFLKKAIEENQFILLGEVHNSKGISELTKAFIPEFRNNGGKYFGLEVGPTSAKILQELSSIPENSVNNLKKMNTENSFEYSRGTYTPIPFFSNISDAEFLETASIQNLKLIGLDQEFKFGFIPLVERAFNNLSKEKQELYKSKYEKTIDTLKMYYVKEFDFYDKRTDENKRFSFLLNGSKFVNDFLKNIAMDNPENKKIVEDLLISNQIYFTQNKGNYWESNRLRTENFIRNFKNGLDSNNFDFESDKMLIKVGGLHTAKGMNSYRMFDIGNTVFELARINNKSSLHICFMSRYSFDNDTIVDAMDDTKSWNYRSFKDFIQMGKKDQWTIIDLRPLRNYVYYKRKYLINDSIKEYFDRYDIIIIKPLEISTQLNIEK